MILEHLVYFNSDKLEDEQIVQLECNACDDDDFVFYSGDGTQLTVSGWLTKAVVHGYKHHEARMRDLSIP